MRTLAIACAMFALSYTTAVAQVQGEVDESHGCPYFGNPGHFLSKGSNLCVNTPQYHHHWELLECVTNIQASANAKPYVWKALGAVDPHKSYCSYHYPSLQ